MGLEIGDIIDGKYRIVRLLGEGGMGSVFEGENLRIHRRVAIKILHASVASSEDAVQRFEREAQAAGRIGSEHIVEVLDLGELPGGDRYMVMEFLDGEALNDRIERLGQLSPQQSASIMVDILEGLKAAHDAGIIHRDLKPDNVFLLTSRGGKADFVKVVDFGISKFSTLGGEFSMTQTGAVMGTPYYLSPEQAKGQRNVDQRADIYACGVILWEATVGRVPFDGETFNELMFKIVLEPVPNLRDILPDLNQDFVGIVEKAMAREPDQRFASADEMQTALRAWLSGQPLSGEQLSGQRTAAHVPAAPLTAHATLAGAGQTGGTWANTNPEQSAKKSRFPLIAAAAAVLILAGGGALYASHENQMQEEAAAQAAAEQEQERLRIEHEQAEEIARLEAERAKAEARRALAEKDKSEAERERAQAELSRAEQAAQLAKQEQEREEEEEAKRLAAARRAARAAQTQKAVKAPSPAPAPTSSVGRKIRTDL
jgi:serine/threonine-protein kinase